MMDLRDSSILQRLESAAWREWEKGDDPQLRHRWKMLWMHLNALRMYMEEKEDG